MSAFRKPLEIIERGAYHCRLLLLIGGKKHSFCYYHKTITMAIVNDIKYYPDRFYIRMNGCDLDTLFVPQDDYTLSLDQAVFIHEYYHYLTNISTFQGVRSFHSAFCDLFRLVTILTYKRGLNAFPINSNDLDECAYEVNYWNDCNFIFREDSISESLVEETRNSPSRSFRILSIEKEKGKVFSVQMNGKVIQGQREHLAVKVEGLTQTNSFHLPIGALDEFLSASIDEYLFEKGLSNYKEIFNNRPFYPYRLFDEFLRYFKLQLGSRSKILIAYFAIHSQNPAVRFYDILERISQDGVTQIENDPCEYLERYFPLYFQYDCLINEINKFIVEARTQNRKRSVSLLMYFQDRFITSITLLKKDPLFFVRPFMIDNLDVIDGRKEFWESFIQIKMCFPEPLFIQEKDFQITRTDKKGAELTILALAIYEIIESLEENKVACRLDHYKNKFNYPHGSDNSDDVTSFIDPPLTDEWHIALNELGLYQFYRDNVHLI